MNNKEKDNMENNAEECEAPSVSWRVLDALAADAAELEARKVDCSRCPVNLMCMEGTDGSGYTCRKCRATSVLVGEEDSEGYQRNALVLDCAKHKFPEDRTMAQCALCSGALSAVEKRYGYEFGGVRHHVVFTEHAKVPIKTRLKVLKEYLDKFEASDGPK